MSASERSWFAVMSPSGKRDGDGDVAMLASAGACCVSASAESLPMSSSGNSPPGFSGDSCELRGVVHEVGPSRIERQGLALFENQFLEFLDPQILNQKLDARAVAIFLFASRANTLAMACVSGSNSSGGINESNNLA